MSSHADKAAGGRPGVAHLAVVSSYLLWGLFPLYFAALWRVSVWEVVSYRVIGLTAVLTAVLILHRVRYRGRRPGVWSGLRGNRLLLIGASASIGVVWWVYSYGVVSGMAVDVSLGYFACPLVGLLLAAMVEHDSVSALSWLAGLLGISALAASGVLMGKVPWVALSISVAFALYGLFKKRLGARGVSNLASLYGEGIVLLPGAVVGLVVVQASEGLAFGRAGFAFESLLLLFAGGLTLLPLWLFSSGVRTLQLGVTSTLQFINPAIQLLIGTLVLHEPMTLARWVAILLVWAALLCAMVDLSIPRGRPSVRPMTAADAPRKWEQV